MRTRKLRQRYQEKKTSIFDICGPIFAEVHSGLAKDNDPSDELTSFPPQLLCPLPSVQSLSRTLEPRYAPKAARDRQTLVLKE